MSRTWVVVADNSRARLFEIEKSSDVLKEIEDLAHPEGRLQDRELTTDLPGRYHDGGGAAASAMNTNVSPSGQEMIKFAKRVGNELESARTQNIEHLIIIAAPAFLGHLRNNLSEPLKKLVTHEIDKNLAQHDVKDIRAHLPERV